MDKNKESTAYKRITDILKFSCDLTSYECYVLRGWLAYCAGEAEKAEALQKSRSHRNLNHKPNITMINCNSK